MCRTNAAACAMADWRHTVLLQTVDQARRPGIAQAR